MSLYLNITGASASAGKGWNRFGDAARVLEHVYHRGEVTLISTGHTDQRHGHDQGET